MSKLIISPKWDDIRTFDEICDNSKFSYFFIDKHNNLAPNGLGDPHIVSGKSKTGLLFDKVGSYGGVYIKASGTSGFEFIKEVQKTYVMDIYKDPKECVKRYFELSDQTEFIVN